MTGAWVLVFILAVPGLGAELGAPARLGPAGVDAPISAALPDLPMPIAGAGEAAARWTNLESQLLNAARIDHPADGRRWLEATAKRMSEDAAASFTDSLARSFLRLHPTTKERARKVQDLLAGAATALSGEATGKIIRFFDDGKTVYAAADRGLFSRRDDGAWVKPLELKRGTAIHDVIHHKGRLYIASDSGLWARQDGEREWRKVRRRTGAVHSLARKDDILLAGTDEGLLIISPSHCFVHGGGVARPIYSLSIESDRLDIGTVNGYREGRFISRTRSDVYRTLSRVARGEMSELLEGLIAWSDAYSGGPVYGATTVMGHRLLAAEAGILSRGVSGWTNILPGAAIRGFRWLEGTLFAFGSEGAVFLEKNGRFERAPEIFQGANDFLTINGELHVASDRGLKKTASYDHDALFQDAAHEIGRQSAERERQITRSSADHGFKQDAGGAIVDESGATIFK